jgi:hypothetical protein
MPKSSKPQSADSLKRATLIRRFVLRNPNANLEDLQKYWDKAGYPSASRPKKSQDLYLVRSVLKRKYGINSLDQIPLKKSGELNVTGLLRLVRKQKPKITERACRAFVAADGVEFSSALWSVMLKADGVRGVRVTNKTRRAKAQVASVNVSSGSELLEIESRLDDLIEKARVVNESEMVQLLKNARRHVSQSILNAR